MDHIQERLSYIEGLAEGMDLYQNKKEGKFYDELIHVLSDMNRSLEGVINRLTELEEYVEAIDEDLNDVEWDFYEGDDDDEEDDDYDDDLEEYLMQEDLEAEDGYYQVVCPNCNETVLVDHHVFDQNDKEEVVCPNCREILVIETEDDMSEELQI